MSKRAKVPVVILGSLGCLVLAYIGCFWFILPAGLGIEPWIMRKPRFEEAARTGMVVIEAIERFQADHGQPPGSLDELVPDYLPEKPHTGMRDYPEYTYTVFDDSEQSLVWHDLGSRQGKPMSGLWVYPDGDREHAILVFELNQDNCVIGARVDRMPEESEAIAFDREKWTSRESRIEMARDIPQQLSLEHATLERVREVLGQPDGSRVLRNTPWELGIDCPNGMLNWDVFFYWPTQDYPQRIYGGTVERIGAWCYVHE